MKLFLDDMRIPSDVGYINDQWTIVRDYKTFCVLIKAFYPQQISFDHDLHDYDEKGNELTGMSCAKFLVDCDSKCNAITKDFLYRCHSANPAGKANIEGLLNGYFIHKFGTTQGLPITK